MMYLTFNKDNNNSYTINYQDKISFVYHINTSVFDIEHGHKDYWEFTVLTNGKLIHNINGKKRYVGQKSLFFATTKDIHNMEGIVETNKLRYINFIVREEKVLSIASSFSPRFIESLLNGKREYSLSESIIMELENIIHKINMLEKDNYAKYEDLLCSAVVLILQHIFLATLSSKEGEGSFIETLNEKMNDVNFIKMNVEELSKEMNCSRMQLNRLIKEYYGQTPHEFLLDYKLRYALSLLESTDMGLEEIIDAVGYSSFSSFINNFKKKYGTTPHQVKIRKPNIVPSDKSQDA